MNSPFIPDKIHDPVAAEFAARMIMISIKLNACLDLERNPTPDQLEAPEGARLIAADMLADEVTEMTIALTRDMKKRRLEWERATKQ